jgi:hypothetical protein
MFSNLVIYFFKVHVTKCFKILANFGQIRRKKNASGEIWHNPVTLSGTDLEPLGQAEVRIDAAFVKHDLRNAFFYQLVVRRSEKQVVSYKVVTL